MPANYRATLGRLAREQAINHEPDNNLERGKAYGSLSMVLSRVNIRNDPNSYF
jgi:hypothetical protein